MSDDATDDLIKVKPAAPANPYAGLTLPEARRKKKPPRRTRDEVKKHFSELAEAAEKLHEILVEKRSPYRFCVYMEGDEVLIDMVVLGEDGKIKDLQKKNITHAEFMTWMEHVEKAEGLLIDNKA